MWGRAGSGDGKVGWESGREAEGEMIGKGEKEKEREQEGKETGEEVVVGTERLIGEVEGKRR